MVDWKKLGTRSLDAREPAELALDPRRRHRDRRQGWLMLRRHHAAQGRRPVGYPLCRPAGRPARGQSRHHPPDPVPRHPRDRTGRRPRRGNLRQPLPRMQGISLRAGRPRRQPRDEDDTRWRRPPDVQGDRGPGRRPRALSAQQDPWHYTLGKMVDACVASGIKPFYGPFGDIADLAACERQFRNAYLMGCAGAWSLHPARSTSPSVLFTPKPPR